MRFVLIGIVLACTVNTVIGQVSDSLLSEALSEVSINRSTATTSSVKNLNKNVANSASSWHQNTTFTVQQYGLSGLGTISYHGLSAELPRKIHKISGLKKIVTIHDLIFLRYPKLYSSFDVIFHTKKIKYACGNNISQKSLNYKDVYDSDWDSITPVKAFTGT